MRPFKRKKKPAYGFSSFEVETRSFKPFECTDTLDQAGFMSNFAIMIHTQSCKVQKSKKPPRWKRLLCFIFGHRWGFAGISYFGPGHPKKCKRCKKNKWFKK